MLLLLLCSYATAGTVPDVVAGVPAAVAGVVGGKTGARLGAVAARKMNHNDKRGVREEANTCTKCDRCEPWMEKQV